MARLRFLVVLLACACVLPRARAEDEPAEPPPVLPIEEVLLARIEADPEGEATRLAREAAAALEADQPELAARRLMALHARHPDALVPVTLLGAVLPGRLDGALHWPAHRAVGRAIARLPAEVRARVFEAWAPTVEALVARVARHDAAALERLAERYGATHDGGRALLALADRELEAGRLVDAARRLEAWLELQPEAPEPARAVVAVRLADVLLALDDAGGLRTLALRHADLREASVMRAGEPTTLADRMAAARAVAAERRRRAQPPPTPRLSAAALEEPVVLWTRSLRDPGYLRQGLHGGALVVQAGAWGPDDRTVVLHEGRVVRRLDPATGLERWRFPRTQRPTLHDLVERYQGHDLPWRAVTPAGDAVLVALGEPNASGRYEFLGEEYEADQLGQECRVRLACLDLETGALRWHTGAVGQTHPVLGNRNTGVCSPPLVVGQDVYCLFARRDGATSFHLACLDLATGAARWVCDLVGGDSGRDEDVSLGSRFTSPFAQSVPWGARPALADGEVCALPHAGFAAGVRASDGRLRWVRALPRHAIDANVVHASQGHSVQNAPLPWGDAWIVAPMDSPRMLCLARGSGDLRWQVGGRTPDDLPRWRDLLGVRAAEDGAPVLRLSGDEGLMRMDPADGAWYHDLDEPWEPGEADPGGRTVDMGAYALRATVREVQVRPWKPSGDVEIDAALLRLNGRDLPEGGDLVPVGRIWLLIGPERVAAVAQPKDVAALLASDEHDAPAVRAARRALLARIEEDPRGMIRALEAAREIADPDARAVALEHASASLVRLVRALADTPDELDRLRTLAVVTRSLPVAQRGPALRTLARRFFALEAYEDGTSLCLHWIATADDTLVPRARHHDPQRDDRVRGDLLAAALLRRHAARPEVAALLDEHERAAAARVAAAKDSNDEALRAAIRRGAGTRAAAQGRRLLLRRLQEAGRFADAAAVAADLRLDAPWRDAARPREERLRATARLQMEEAQLLAEAGDAQRARTLAADLERWAPTDLLDRRGRDARGLSRALTKRFGWHPYVPDAPAEVFPFDVWRHRAAPKNRDEMRAVEFLGVTGPGARRLGERYVVLARGLTIEVWSLAQRKLVASLPGDDEGWFGGSLRSIDRWVPGGGILVTSLVAGEPADGSGVRAGDWVHTWHGEPVTDLPAFMQLVASSAPEQRIPVGIWRGGEKVLTRFTAGRRPVGQGRLVTHAPVWVDERMRLLVPGRTGLTWIDPEAGTRTPHFRWRERGVVRRCLAVGGEVFVTINRGILPDLLVAVDLASGRERWRVELQGAITWFEPVGSALWVQALAPGQALVVDRRTGSVRARYRTFDRYRHVFRKTWEPDREVGLASGRAFVAAGTDADLWLRIVNTTTARPQEAASWSYGTSSGFRGRYVNPMVSAGAYACVACQGGVRLLFPDPLGEQPPRQLQASQRDLMGNETHHGPVDSDTRLYVRGHTLYVLRMPLHGRKNVNVHVFGIDYDVMERQAPTAQGGAGRVLYSRSSRAWLTGPASPYRYALHAQATFEGILVAAAQLTGGHHAETWWVSSDAPDAHDDNRDVKLLWQPMNEARRHEPKRAGVRLFVALDEGAKVWPVRIYADE